MSQIEWLSARQAYLTVDSGFSQVMSAFYKKANLKPDLIKIYEDIGNDYRSMVTPIPLEYERIEHSTLFKIGDRVWKPVFGSGHSPDHVSFYCEKDRIMLGGDMLLPRITPIIAVWWQEPNADPLKGYIEFLETLGSIGSDALILPAHNRPYKELQTRVADLIFHHNERLEITYEACKNENSANSIMQKLFTRKLDPFQTRFAIGETIAHINNLVKKGTLKRRLDDDGVYFYSQN
jgi:glyoxylase-like metal-dependent hydrolase (beta-lactamase superfamily II)